MISISDKGNDKGTLFKKTIFGINEGQVAEYIQVQEENLRHASEVFEEKLEDMRNTVALATREKESLASKLQKTQKQLDEIISKCNEYEKILKNDSKIKEEAIKIHRENEDLKEQIEQYQKKIEKTTMLEDQVCDLQAKCNFFEKDHNDLLNEVEILKKNNQIKTDELLAENKKLEEYISKKRIEVSQGLKNHKYDLKKVEDLIENIKITFENVNKSFGDIQE
jgi:chromosome segregation ATPase